MHLPKHVLARFVLAAGAFLVLFGIYAFGGRTEMTLKLLTFWVWLAIGITIALWFAELREKRRKKPGKRARSIAAAAQADGRKSRNRDGESRRAHSSVSRGSSASRPMLHGRSMVRWPSKLAILTIVCWGGLILQQWIGFQNPSYYPAGPDLYDGIYPLESNPNLPTTANATRGWSYLLIFAGTLSWTALTATCGRNRKAITRAVFLVFFGFSLLAALGTLARLSGTDKILWIFESHTSYFFGTLFYKNHWGELAALMAAVGIGLALRFWREEKHSGHFPDRTVSFSCLVFLMALTIPLANARGATLALGGVILVLAITLVRRGKRKAESGKGKAESGKGKVESGKQKTESRKLKAERGKWKVESGELKAEREVANPRASGAFSVEHRTSKVEHRTSKEGKEEMERGTGHRLTDSPTHEPALSKRSASNGPPSSDLRPPSNRLTDSSRYALRATQDTPSNRLTDSPSRLTAFIPFLAILGLLVGIGAFLYLSAPSIEEGIEKTERQWSLFKDDGNAKYPELRGYLWEDALRAFAARPIFGWGLGSYVHVQLVYAGEKLRSIGGGDQPPLVEFAHNDYLQWLVEFGIVGTILLLLPPIAAVIKVVRHGRIGTLASWIAVGLLAFLFTAAIDFPFSNPALALTACWLAAVAYADSMGRNGLQSSDEKSPTRRPVAA